MTGHGCRLLAGPAALSAQVVLAAIALISLIYKRHAERPQRPVKVWAMDVSKQVVSTGVAHAAGMSIAIVLATRAFVSECAWYFVAFTFDTTLGVAIALGLHTAAVRAAKRLTSEEPRSPVLTSIADCGSYGSPPTLWRLWPQLLEFTVAVLVARACCGALIYLLRDPLTHIAYVLDIIFQGHPTGQLYFVMIACPLTMNVLQALIQDTVLKRHKHVAGTLPGTGHAGADGPQLNESTSLVPGSQLASDNSRNVAVGGACWFGYSVSHGLSAQSWCM